MVHSGCFELGADRDRHIGRALAARAAEGIEIPEVLFENRAMLVRRFNAEGDAAERTASFGLEPARVDTVELDGRLIGRLDVRRTLRCELT